MSGLSNLANLARLAPGALITVVMLTAPAVAELPAQAAAITPEQNRALKRQRLQAYREAITSIESNQGAYGADLPETLLGLGLSLQAEGDHQEAVVLFRRGVHLTRVNEGLYSRNQIPLLQAEIQSHIAGQDYAMADDRQRYLHRVQTRSPAAGMGNARALMQHAEWQYSAYQLGLEKENYPRLMSMWGFYHRAYLDIYEQEGETSPELLPPLNGMLQSLYLMSRYQFKEPDAMYSDDVMARLNQQRFTSLRAQNFERGTRIIESIYKVESSNGKAEQARADSLVMLGDWHLWHGERQGALNAYTQAAGELNRLEDAQLELDDPLGEPVPLPALDALAPLPPVVEGDAEGNGEAILLEFGVTRSGKVIDIERLDDNQAYDNQARRLMRKLRKTRFRPRFEAGQPIDTESIVKAFDTR